MQPQPGLGLLRVFDIMYLNSMALSVLNGSKTN